MRSMRPAHAIVSASFHVLCVAALMVAFVLTSAHMGGVRVETLTSADLVSGATTIQEAPSGHFTIVVNRKMHPDEDVLGLWKEFLVGHDVPLIMEDVTCAVAAEDAAGIELAVSLSSRLPANQMKVKRLSSVLVISKAEEHLFDILVLSDEMADVLEVSALLSDPDVEVVRR